MIEDPSVALAEAIKFRLDGGISAAVVDGLTDADPWPRIEIGEGQIVGNRADCYDGSEIFLEIHIWSRPAAGNWAEAKRIANKIRTLLDDVDLPLHGHVLEILSFRDTRFIREPDGTAFHAVMTFRALTQPSD